MRFAAASSAESQPRIFGSPAERRNAVGEFHPASIGEPVASATLAHMEKVRSRSQQIQPGDKQGGDYRSRERHTNQERSDGQFALTEATEQPPTEGAPPFFVWRFEMGQAE